MGHYDYSRDDYPYYNQDWQDKTAGLFFVDSDYNVKLAESLTPYMRYTLSMYETRAEAETAAKLALNRQIDELQHRSDTLKRKLANYSK